jgi:hypothetical protein
LLSSINVAPSATSLLVLPPFLPHFPCMGFFTYQYFPSNLLTYHTPRAPRWRSRYSDSLRDGRSEDRMQQVRTRTIL